MYLLVQSIMENLFRQLMRQWFSEERGGNAIFSKPRFHIKLSVINLFKERFHFVSSKKSFYLHFWILEVCSISAWTILVFENYLRSYDLLKETLSAWVFMQKIIKFNIFKNMFFNTQCNTAYELIIQFLFGVG